MLLLCSFANFLFASFQISILIVGVVSAISLLAVVGLKLGWSYDVTGNPLTFFSIVCAILSIQLFSLGLIGELSVRIYYSSGVKKSFQVREFINFDLQDGGVNKPDSREKERPDSEYERHARPDAAG